jgi:mRNA-decapping enzyme subunit 2
VLWRDPQGTTTTIADTNSAYRVLETSHPPTYYIPPKDVRVDLLSTSAARRTLCEWKGMATYHDLTPPGALEPAVNARIWSYPEPTPSFRSIAGYLSFYARSQANPAKGGWTCYVDDDEVNQGFPAAHVSILTAWQVIAQDGDFYGGWRTSEIEGGDRGFKGGMSRGVITCVTESHLFSGPGTWGW